MLRWHEIDECKELKSQILSAERLRWRHDAVYAVHNMLMLHNGPNEIQTVEERKGNKKNVVLDDVMRASHEWHGRSSAFHLIIPFVV